MVHHTGHHGDRERGSSALGAAADARLQLVRDGRTPRLSLTNPKQKDAAEHRAIDLQLKPVAGSLVLSRVPPEQAARDTRATADDVRERVFASVVENAPASKRTVRGSVRRQQNARRPCPLRARAGRSHRRHAQGQG
ncbi:MAG: helicase RepA family protein [Actinomycetota bacterium]|nr:helicase RepA family protein [Actinomycetota bacterium]